MSVVAAVDCGTNSIRLLILRAAGGVVEELAREVRLARLGQGVDATGEFHEDALRRAFAVFDEFSQLIERHGAARVRVVATSAARDVRNRDVFAAGVLARFGVEAEVISGDEEARLSALGVLSGVAAKRPALVIDIGGGSTELVLVDDVVRRAVSLDVGAVRVSERFLFDDPPTAAQVAEARRFVGGLIDASGIDFASVVSAIGVAGTVTSVAARVLGLREYSRQVVHETRIGRADIIEAATHWLGRTHADIATEPCMHPLRAGVIGAGALILDELSGRIPGGEVLVSECDILDGVALSLVERR
ncbi:Ppx/GppA phosphatase family protein [Tessaracoccus sp. OH4464_COT-324]|uniref:Ppx/GppA phosphatase family protein n=1 Tax=Tessaracoccus sp. OH4464_COT-324 TaxID=2491059 RepID=UPI000F633D94|nr:Ppx/GppA phosphatase family protein [Tessaracoccus sp. OH4464_COT-324]RRD45247.1 Ppx/GppA family phosphatase [Tessaracoccus sp. OH4464_COT-324]